MKVILVLPRQLAIVSSTHEAQPCLPLALTNIVLEVEHCVSWTNTFRTVLGLALCVYQLLTERFVVGFCRRLLDNDLLPVVGDLVDNPLGGLAELEFIESGDTFGADGNTGGGAALLVVVVVGMRGVREVVSCCCREGSGKVHTRRRPE